MALLTPENLSAEHRSFSAANEMPENVIRHNTESGKTFDNFMRNYVGDPFLDNFPEVRRINTLAGERSYGNRILSYLYSQEGSLVHVRRTNKPDPNCPESDYFVASADLGGGAPVEWAVLAVEYSGKGDNLAMELTLRYESLGASLYMDSQSFMWDSGKGNGPETLLPGTELSLKLQN